LANEWCSAGFTAWRQVGTVVEWYGTTAGHCFSTVCGLTPLTTPLRHDPLDPTTVADRHVHAGWTYWNHLFASATPYDLGAFRLGTTSSLTSPPADASRIVRSSTGLFGLRPIASFGDPAFLNTTGVTFESFGHTTGPDTQVFAGITSAVTVPCSGYTHQWFIVTNTGASGCAGGDSGGPLFGIYYPFANTTAVSVLGQLSFSMDTGFGRLCYWAQPGFALTAMSLTGYKL
jgi:hypothetical protein